MIREISPVLMAVRSDKLLISWATTPKLLPWSPAWAAMIAALRERSFVLSLISLMILTTPSTAFDDSPSSSMARAVSRMTS